MPWYLKKNLVFKIGGSGHLHSRIEEIKTIHHPDILFLGTSHAFKGFDPRIFKSKNLSTFNLGSRSQSALQTKVLVSQYIDKIQPKLVVYEVWPWFLETDGVESAEDLIANNKLDWESVKMIASINHIRIYNSFIYSLFRQIFKMDEGFHQDESYIQPDGAIDTYIPGGYDERSFSINHSNCQSSYKSPWTIRDNQYKSFIEIVELLKQKGIPLLLVQTPMTKPFYEAKSNNVEIDSLFSANADYINFNLDKELNLNDTLHFYDCHHLNNEGVKRFNERFIRALEQKGIL